MTRALLIGREPAVSLGFSYVREAPFEAVVIGSLTLSQLLRFQEESVLQALAEGKQVYLYSPGLPVSPGNRSCWNKFGQCWNPWWSRTLF